jgi:hypothetical protein
MAQINNFFDRYPKIFDFQKKLLHSIKYITTNRHYDAKTLNFGANYYHPLLFRIKSLEKVSYLEAAVCRCPIKTLMQFGCQCGGA